MKRRWLVGVVVGATCAVGVEGRARADVAACIAANDEGLAMRKAGRLRDAAQRLTACADPACPDEVRVECNARITEIQALLPKLQIVVTDARGADVAAEITVDGARVQGFVASPTPIDPGPHAVRVSAPGLVPVDRTIVMRTGETQRRETFALSPPSFWTTQRILGVSSFGLGVAGLIVGGVFTGFAASAKSREGADCSASACPNQPQAVADYNAAVSNATGAEVGFIAGGVFAAAGVVLFATARSPVVSTSAAARSWTMTPWIGVGREGHGLSIRGTF